MNIATFEINLDQMCNTFSACSIHTPTDITDITDITVPNTSNISHAISASHGNEACTRTSSHERYV